MSVLEKFFLYFPLIVVGLVGVTNWTPFKKPDWWMYNYVEPEGPRRQEDRALRRKWHLFRFQMILAMFVWYSIPSIFYWLFGDPS